MSKTAYNITLKGYVGGSDFDRNTVDKELAENDGKLVNVLIDSLGGSLATGLDKLDLNVASLYAKKCSKPVADLLALMKAGGWLTAKEALDWGFVDEITDLADEPAPKLTDALASAMASAGMPIPNIPVSVTDEVAWLGEEPERESAFGKFITAIVSLFNSKSNTQMSKETTKSEPQDNSDVIADLKKQITDRDTRIAELEAKLAKTPAEPSKQVVEDAKPQGEPAPKK